MGFSSLSVHFSGESVILVGFSSLSVHLFWLWFDGWVLVNRFSWVGRLVGESVAGYDGGRIGGCGRIGGRIG